MSSINSFRPPFFRLALFAGLLPAILTARAQSYSRDVKTVLDSFEARHNFNGMVAIWQAKKGVAIWPRGVANRETKTRFSLFSRFRIASLTKTFTAVLVMQLVEKGRLDLNATIGTYFPEYTGEARDKVTLLNLLTYSSGIPDCEHGKDMMVYETPISVDSFISRYCSDRLESRPGSKFAYGNGDYIILGRILEKVSGKPFATLLADQILKPLRLRNTGMAHTGQRDLVPNYLYDDSLKTFSPDPPYLIENFFAAGAMFSTPADLELFDLGIFTYKLLTKKTVDSMITPHPDLGNVGIGFWQSSAYGKIDQPFVYRPGGIQGATLNWIHVPGKSELIIVCSNTNATDLFGLCQAVYEAMNKKE